MNKAKNDTKIYGVYIKSILCKKVVLSITEIGKNLKQNLEKKIVSMTEGKCIREGFVKPNSVKIINYSSGVIDSENIVFDTTFQCQITHPVEGMIIECTTKTITKVGIHAEKIDEDGVIPLVIFIARDHNYNNKTFNTIKENMNITIRVIGIRFEIDDLHIQVLGKLASDYKPEMKKLSYKGGDEDFFEEEEEEEEERKQGEQEEI
jgi:DNA-directed RNA polymerase subunit E'/Rpb7